MSRAMRQDRMPPETITRVIAVKCRCMICGTGFSRESSLDENGLCLRCRNRLPKPYEKEAEND